MKWKTILSVLMAAFCNLLSPVRTLALTSGEQADAFLSRGGDAEKRGDLLAAANCYQLALRAKEGHRAAQLALAELAKRTPGEMFEQMLGFALEQETYTDRTPRVSGGQDQPAAKTEGATVLLTEALEILRGKISRSGNNGWPATFVIRDSAGKLQASQVIVPDPNKARTVQEFLDTCCLQAWARYQLEDGKVLVLPKASTPPENTSAPTGPNPPPAPPGDAGARQTAGTAAELLSWTNTSGKMLKAAFVRMEGAVVVLKTAEGTEFRYPLSSLNPAGQARARSLEVKEGGR